MTRAYWKKGALYGFLFPLLWLSVGMLPIAIAAMFRLETLAGIIDAFFMLPFVPMAIIQQRFGIVVISLFFTTILFWTFIGAIIGYLVGRHKNKIAEIK